LAVVEVVIVLDIHPITSISYSLVEEEEEEEWSAMPLALPFTRPEEKV
jgi:hypothetical protein